MSDSPFIFAKWAVRLGSVALFGVDGMAVEAAAEAVAAISRDMWDRYLSQRTPQDRCRDIEAVAQAEVATLVAAVAEDIHALPEPKRKAAEAYVSALPGVLRATMKRPADPSGRTALPALIPQRAEDVQLLLPTRPLRFRVGDRPVGIGDWELTEILGVGGFGEVWKARNPHMPGRFAALKFCLDATAAASLRREAALLDRVSTIAERHSGIVLILNTALSAEPPCIVYELVEGGMLAGFIRERHAEAHAMGADAAARLMLELAETMAVCHASHPAIVHRDLKPANILVDARTGRLRITDFGIGGIEALQALQQASRLTGAQHSQACALGSHTPLYASPQQMRGEPPDARDDVHALGVIWWQVLCRDLGVGVPSGKWMKKLSAAGHPDALVEILAECVEQDAAERLPSAVVLAERLRTALGVGAAPALGTGAAPVSRPGADAVLQPPSESSRVEWSVPTRPLTVEGLTRDPFETLEEHARSLAGLDWLEAGTVALDKGYYDIHQQLFRLPRDVSWAQFMQKPHQPQGSLLLRADRDLAVQAYNGGREQSLYVRLQPDGDKGYFVREFSLRIHGRHLELLDSAVEMKRPTLNAILAAMVPIPPEAQERAAFAMCKYEVTQGWYEAVTGSNPSQIKGEANRPVESVSWHDAKAFCQQLNDVSARAGLHVGRKFVLPTEAQWEQACLAGSQGNFGLLASGEEGTEDEMTWHGHNSGQMTHPVGVKHPNAWGLHDMHGNVMEWCEDSQGSNFVVRGGSFRHGPGNFSARQRNFSDPNFRADYGGFRLASVPV